MKKIIISILTLFVAVASGNAWGFDIPFTEKRFVVFEDDKFIGVSEQITMVETPVIEQTQIHNTIQQEQGIDVSQYVNMYPDLAEKYQNKVFEIRTDKRVMKGYLSESRLIENNNLDHDYLIEVESEDKIMQMVSEFQLNGTLPSIIDLESQISAPLSIRKDVLFNFFN